MDAIRKVAASFHRGGYRSIQNYFDSAVNYQEPFRGEPVELLLHVVMRLMRFARAVLRGLPVARLKAMLSVTPRHRWLSPRIWSGQLRLELPACSSSESELLEDSGGLKIRLEEAFTTPSTCSVKASEDSEALQKTKARPNLFRRSSNKAGAADLCYQTKVFFGSLLRPSFSKSSSPAAAAAAAAAATILLQGLAITSEICRHFCKARGLFSSGLLVPPLRRKRCAKCPARVSSA